MKNKEENINKESIESIKEFNEKQIEINIKIHICVLSMIIIINICLLIFIISYKYKIKEIKNKNDTNSSKLNTNTNNLTSLENLIYYKLVNLFSRNIKFSLLFNNSDEISSLKNSIKTLAKFENPHFNLIYSSFYDGFKSKDLLNSFQFFANNLFYKR